MQTEQQREMRERGAEVGGWINEGGRQEGRTGDSIVRDERLQKPESDKALMKGEILYSSYSGREYTLTKLVGEYIL